MSGEPNKSLFKWEILIYHFQNWIRITEKKDKEGVNIIINKLDYISVNDCIYFGIPFFGMFMEHWLKITNSKKRFCMSHFLL